MRLLGELGDLVGSANQGALLQIEGKTGDLLRLTKVMEKQF